MFFGGIERKLATLSVGLDYFLGDIKINTVFSPLHSTNRIPLGDDDFPVRLPIYPDESEIFPISGVPYEGGIRVHFLAQLEKFLHHILQDMTVHLI